MFWGCLQNWKQYKRYPQKVLPTEEARHTYRSLKSVHQCRLGVIPRMKYKERGQLKPTCDKSHVHRDHPRCRSTSVTWICMCGMTKWYIPGLIKIYSGGLEPKGSKFGLPTATVQALMMWLFLFPCVHLWLTGGGGGRSGTVGGMSPRCFVWVLSKRSIPKPDQNRDVIQQESLGTDLL